MRKLLHFLVALICPTTLYGQSRADSTHEFRLTYSVSGLGGNFLDSFEVFCIEKGAFINFREEPFIPEGLFKNVGGATIQNSGLFRQSSIDSIIAILKLVKPQKVFRSNPCIISGEAHCLSIAIDNKCWEFELMNTFDEVTSSVLGVLNTYLNGRQRFYIDKQASQKEQDCWRKLRKASP